MEDPVLIAVAAVVASSLLILVPQWIRRHLEAKEPLPGRGVPMAPSSHWFFGHVFQLLSSDFRESMKWAKSCTNEHGQAAFWTVTRPVLYVFNWQDAKTVLNKEHSRQRPKFLSRHAAKVNGERGLLALNGKDWRFHRMAVTKTFNPEFLNGARQDMKEVTETMVQSIQNKISSSKETTLEMNIEPLMKCITVDIFGKTALNVDLKSCSGDLKASPMAEAFDYIISQFMIRMRSPFKPQHAFYWLPTEQNRRQAKERHLIRSFLADLINEKRKALQNGEKVAGKDLLSHLLKAHHDVQDMEIVSAKEVTDDNLVDILMSLFIAGFDTTSITLAYALHMLAADPKVQEQCVQEIQNTKGDLVNADDLVLCKAVVWETLRMFPPGVITLRTLTKPLTLSGGLVVPKGMNVTIPIYGIHHDEAVFPQPDDFRPDRWAAQDAKGQWTERGDGDEVGSIVAGNRQAMLAFSAGGRNCVGVKFAVQEAVLGLANLLNGLKFDPVPGFELKTSTKSMLLKPENGVQLGVSNRHPTRLQT
jgi:cytochrome P450